jgi:hypothetical protein
MRNARAVYHWTDRKIRIHAFYCMRGISLLQYLHKQAQAAWNGCLYFKATSLAAKFVLVVHTHLPS